MGTIMDVFAAIDLGTTGVKAALFDTQGTMLAQASQEQHPDFPEPGLVEQDPIAWYEVPCALLREALQRSGLSGCRVNAVGFSSQGISVVPTDGAFLPLRKGISWLDVRAQEELDDMLQLFSADDWFHMTGKHIDAAYTLPKILWLKKHEPQVMRETQWLLMPMDYCIARMVGRPVTDPTMASGTMLSDLHGSWRDDLTCAFGISAGKLATVVPCGTVAGGLNDQSAARIGIPAGTPVVVGAQDQKIAAYGARLSRTCPTLSLGTSGAMEFIADGRSDTLPAFPHMDGREMLLEACINTTGAAIRWVRDMLFAGGYDEMDKAAAAAPIGAQGVVFRPYLSGSGTPHLQQELSGSWEGLTLATTRGSLARAVYEGLACEIRWNIDCAREAGSVVEGVRAFGGGINSQPLLAAIAGVCGLPVYVCSQREMGLFGAARAAAEAVGWDTVQFESTAAVLQPRDTDRYEAVYARYRGAKQKQDVVAS